MADARDTKVWNNHAIEQWNENKIGHHFDEDYVLRQWLLETKSTKCLDYGCGGGLWRKLFNGLEYYGADQSPNMIEHAKKRWPEDSFSLFEWNTKPFPDETFDLVFTSAVLQHNKHPDKRKTVQQIVDLIKPHGFFMCTENTFREDNYQHTFPKISTWHADLDDGYSFTKEGWEKFMHSCGLKLIKFQTPSEYLYQKL
jgi:SAM-dependent methyltransferase